MEEFDKMNQAFDEAFRVMFETEFDPNANIHLTGELLEQLVTHAIMEYMSICGLIDPDAPNVD